MKLIYKIADLRNIVKDVKRQGKTIGFVPTMGALHSGHQSLIKAARESCDIVILSIFVNPKQFGVNEDYNKYPRDLKRDMKICAEEGVDTVFCPNVKEMYPDDFSTYVQEEKLSIAMCGKSRPGHFKGVATVVVKLFNIIQPDTAFFGQKDYQQALIIKRTARDLNMPVKIKIMPTIREKDGLAMSSRNKYLSGQDRKTAVNIYKALKKKRIAKKIPGVTLDYFVSVDKDTLEPVKKIKKGTLLAIAGRVGTTRLIDNVIV